MQARDRRTRALVLSIATALVLASLAAGWLALRDVTPSATPRRASDGGASADAEPDRRARDGSGGATPAFEPSEPSDRGEGIAASAPIALARGAADGGAPVPRGEAALRASCERQGRARCEAHARCGCDDADTRETWAALVAAGLVAAGDVPTGDCESAAISECMASIPELRSLVPRLDEVTLDPARTEACMRAIEVDASSCDAWRWPLDCALTMTLSLEPDGTCAEGVELCPGGLCDAQRACVPEPRAGERCVQGLFCGAGHVCDGGRCVARRSRAEGAPCARSEVCATELVCAAGVCTARGRSGAECSEDSCETGLVCDARAHHCRAASAPCAEDADCGARRVCVERDGRRECRPARCVPRIPPRPL